MDSFVIQITLDFDREVDSETAHDVVYDALKGHLPKDCHLRGHASWRVFDGPTSEF